MAVVASAGTLHGLEEKRGKALRRDFVVWDFDKTLPDNKFLAFKAARNFYRFLQSLKPNQRTFCETILEGRQKPRFDLDIKKNELPIMRKPEDIVNELCFAILSVFEEIKLKDILIYSSNSAGGGNKKKARYSYHIVIDNWYHKNSQEARRAYELVVRAMPADLASFVDHSVYKPMQQFRMLYNSKPNEERFKILEKEWKYFGDVIEREAQNPEDDFYSSLITITEDCNHIYMPGTGDGDNSTRVESEDADYDQLRALVPEGYALDPNKKPYGYRLKRIGRSFCVVCNRIHGSDSKGDNARIFIRTGKIYLSCFRDQTKKSHLLDTVDCAEPTIQEGVQKLQGEGLFSPDMIIACDPKQYLSTSMKISVKDIITILEQQQNRYLISQEVQ